MPPEFDWVSIQRMQTNAFGAYDGVAWCRKTGTLLEICVNDQGEIYFGHLRRIERKGSSS